MFQLHFASPHFAICLCSPKPFSNSVRRYAFGSKWTRTCVTRYRPFLLYSEYGDDPAGVVDMRTEVGASSYGSFVRKLSREQKYRVCRPSEGEGFVLGYPAVCNIFNCYLSFLVLGSLFPLLLRCCWTSCEVFCPFMTKPDI